MSYFLVINSCITHRISSPSARSTSPARVHFRYTLCEPLYERLLNRYFDFSYRLVLHFALLHFALKKVIAFCVGKLLHFALNALLHFASMLLHFAAIVITFCVSITFCGDYYILWCNSPFLKPENNIECGEGLKSKVITGQSRQLCKKKIQRK